MIQLSHIRPAETASRDAAPLPREVYELFQDKDFARLMALAKRKPTPSLASAALFETFRWFSGESRIALVGAWLAAGANVNAPHRTNRDDVAEPCATTPLCEAAQLEPSAHKNTLIRMLLDAGADPNQPLSQILPRGERLYRTPLALAVSHCDDPDVAQLLVKRGASLESYCGYGTGQLGWAYTRVTPLMLAAANGHSRTVTRLVNLGANVNAVTDGERRATTALGLAEAERHNTVARFLSRRMDALELPLGNAKRWQALREIHVTGRSAEDTRANLALDSDTLGAIKGRRVLCIAEGVAAFASVLANAGARVTSLDPTYGISDAQFTRLNFVEDWVGREALARRREVPGRVSGWSERLPFKDRTFSHVFAPFMMAWLLRSGAKQARETLSESLRVMRWGGTLRFNVWDVECRAHTYARHLMRVHQHLRALGPAVTFEPHELFDRQGTVFIVKRAKP